MKQITSIFVLIALILSSASMAQTYKPYTLGAESNANINTVIAEVNLVLKNAGFEVIGEYQPAGDKNRRVIIISSPELKTAVKKIGGLRGFALSLRVGITKEQGHVNISYTTPEYWAAAYFQRDYAKVKLEIIKISSKLKNTIAALGSNGGQQFGSKSGMSTNDLSEYHYMFGMPYFQDNVVLKSFDSYADAIQTLDANFNKGVKNLERIYEIELPSKQIKLYGVAMSGSAGEAKFLPTIDSKNPLHTAFLPYEILVYKNKVYMLHGRYRIALSFPDLSMGTFMKIVSTPGNIETLLKTACE